MMHLPPVWPPAEIGGRSFDKYYTDKIMRKPSDSRNCTDHVAICIKYDRGGFQNQFMQATEAEAKKYPYPVIAVTDLANNYSADHFRFAIGHCRDVIAKVVAEDNTSDQQISRVRILRYLDLQLARAVLWIEDEADLMAGVMRSLMELKFWANFVSEIPEKATQFLRESEIDGREMFEHLKKLVPDDTYEPLELPKGKRVAVEPSGEKENLLEDVLEADPPVLLGHKRSRRDGVQRRTPQGSIDLCSLLWMGNRSSFPQDRMGRVKKWHAVYFVARRFRLRYPRTGEIRGQNTGTDGSTPLHQGLRIDPRCLVSKLLHVLDVRPGINSGMAVRAALAAQFQHT